MFFNRIWSLIVCLLCLAQPIAVAADTPTVSKVAGVTLSKEGQKIAEKILEHFPDAPIMLIVANCESTGLVHFEPDPRWKLRPNNSCKTGTCNSSAGGVLQILLDLHKADYTRRGLDVVNSVDDYLEFARYLFERNNERPTDWNASKNCWGKHERNPERAIVWSNA